LFPNTQQSCPLNKAPLELALVFVLSGGVEQIQAVFDREGFRFCRPESLDCFCFLDGDGLFADDISSGVTNCKFPTRPTIRWNISPAASYAPKSGCEGSASCFPVGCFAFFMGLRLDFMTHPE
jgi:hypothetical protein